MKSKLDIDKLLKTYIISVNDPEMSGAEHFNLLQVRDLLYENKSLLTLEQQVSLNKADKELLNQAHLFYEELNRFLKVYEWRRVRAIKPNRWWWFIDLIGGDFTSITNSKDRISLNKVMNYRI